MSIWVSYFQVAVQIFFSLKSPLSCWAIIKLIETVSSYVSYSVQFLYYVRLNYGPDTLHIYSRHKVVDFDTIGINNLTCSYFTALILQGI